MTETTTGFTLWLTGLPCAGKTSLSMAIAAQLRSIFNVVEVLDGDVIRKDFSKDLGFSKEDRAHNVERAASRAAALMKESAVVIVSLVSPYRQDRALARRRIGRFIEIYVRCPLEICEKRDVKGLYRRARSGEIAHFTGVSDPYEEPLQAEIVLDTDRRDIAACVDQVLDHLETSGLIPRRPSTSQPFVRP